MGGMSWTGGEKSSWGFLRRPDCWVGLGCRDVMDLKASFFGLIAFFPSTFISYLYADRFHSYRGFLGARISNSHDVTTAWHLGFIP